MRRRGEPSEVARLVAPLGALADRGFRALPLWLGLLVLAWLGSGITVVQSDEVALVLRFGALQGAGTAQAIREPGLLVAPPRPLGRVVRVPVKRVFEVELRALHYDRRDGTFIVSSAPGVDPRKVGYALTGDRNLVHVAMVARYQISDPSAWAFGWDDPEGALAAVVVDEAARAFGARSVDTVLTDGRADLVEAVVEAAQARLDSLDVGLSVVSLELSDLAPPPQVKNEFAEVQSAAIDAETLLQQAREYRAQVLPLARSTRDAKISEASGSSASVLGAARGEAGAFLALAYEYQASPTVVRERLYREGLEGPLQRAGRVRFVPPPPPGQRNGEFRVTI
ncbi:MAG: HflK protein, partial [Myxococcota bacterium]